jgi:colicin import membrane protein
MTTTEAQVPEITELAVIAPADIQATFSKPGSLKPLLAKIAERARSFTADVNTPRGRRDIASLAAKIAKAKTYLDGVGKDLVEGLKELPKKVDASRKEARDFLDALRDEVRQPLTEWELAEEKRIADRAAALEAERLAKEIENAHELANFINAEFDRKREEEKKAAELAKKEHEERIAKEAAERAKREAEDKAKEEREASARREAEAKKAKERAEQEARDAEARAKAAEEKAAKEKVEATKRAEREKKLAAEREEKAKAEAIEKERHRVEEEKRKADAEQARREANAKNRKKVLGDVAADLVAEGLDKDSAAKVAQAIAEGKIRHTAVTF